MSSFDQAAGRINAAVEKAEIGSEILSQVANGDEFTEVPTTSGPVPSLKKWQKDNMDLISGGVIARVDKAILSYPDYTAASAAAATLPDGQVVEAPDADHLQSEFHVESGALVFDRFSDPPVIYVRDYLKKGEQDHTEYLRAAHIVANSRKVPVSYEGVGLALVQADAQIPVNTDIITGSCKLRLLNGYDPSISSYVDTRKVLFDVSDPDTPLETQNITAQLTASLFHADSVSYFDTLGSGYVRATFNDFRVPWRDDSNTRALEFSAYLLNGKSNLPLFVDLSASLSSVTAKIRRNSYCPIDLGCFTVDLNGANNQSIFHIRRNGVHLGLRWEKEMIDRHSCSSLVWNEDAGDLTIRELNGPGMDEVSSGTRTATYVLNLMGASKIRVSKMWAAKNWAHMGNSYATDFEMRDCDVFRLDAHEHCYDIRAFDCRFLEAMQYGIGGGTWVLERIEMVPTPGKTVYQMFKPRTDYGRAFYGTIQGKDWKFTCPDDAFNVIWDFTDMGSAQINAPMPRIITLDGLRVNLTATDNANPTRTVRLFDYTRGSGKGFIAPILVDLKNVHVDCPRPVAARIYVNPASGTKPQADVSLLRVRNITSSNALNLTLEGVNANITQPVPKWTDVDIADFGSNVNLTINWRDSTLLNFTADDVGKIVSATTTAFPISFILSDSVIDYTGTASKAFGPTSAYRAYSNVLNDCIIYGDPNLSFMNAMSGVLVRQYQTDGSTAIAGEPTLPSGCTLDGAFTGWRSSSVYK